MKMLRTLILSSLLLALLCACGNRQTPSEPAQDAAPPAPPQQEDTTDPPEEPTEAVIDGGELGEETTVIKDSEDGLPLLTACVTRPNVDGLLEGSAKKAVERYYDELYREQKEWWTGGLVDFARENKKAAADYGGDFLPFSALESNEIVYDGDAFLSIRRNTELYTGGAHGSHIVSCENFRKSDGSLVALHELFRTAEYKDTLLRQITDWISQQDLGGEYYDNWEEMLASGFDETSFSIGREALTIFYQEYDIAPYAAGAQMFPISYAAISNELSESFLREIYGGKE